MDDAASVLQLPDDPVELKRVIAQQPSVIIQIKRDSDQAIALRETQLEQIKREAAEQIEAMTQRHKAEMNAILRRFYSPHAQRFDPTQLLLFGLKVAVQLPVDEKVVEAESGEKLKTRGITGRTNHHKHGRGKLPEHLPRIEIVHDLTDDQKKCPCCGEDRRCIGSEISEQLEFDPSALKVLEHIRHKYACKTCGDGCDCKSDIETATKPAQPIEKGLPGSGLLAYVITSKLGDHLPLYRLEKIFSRNGFEIDPDSFSSARLCRDVANIINPLHDRMIHRLLSDTWGLSIAHNETAYAFSNGQRIRVRRLKTMMPNKLLAGVGYDDLAALVL